MINISSSQCLKNYLLVLGHHQAYSKVGIQMEAHPVQLVHFPATQKVTKGEH